MTEKEPTRYQVLKAQANLQKYNDNWIYDVSNIEIIDVETVYNELSKFLNLKD